MLAFAVVLYHYFFYGPRVGAIPQDMAGSAMFEFGRFGVAAFFVISGFVIAQSAEGKTWSAYVASRIARLWPAMAVCAAATTLMALALHGTSLAVELPRFALAAPLLPLLVADANYTDPSYWSITTELRFYALVLVLILLARLERLPLVLSVIGIATFGLHAAGIRTPASALLLFPYIGFFGVGVVFHRFLTDRQAGPAALHGGLQIGLAVWGTHIWSLRHSVFDDGAPTLLQSTVVALGAVALVAGAYHFGRNLSVAPLAPLAGGISYPLYLLHQRFGYDLIAIFSGGVSPEVARFLAIVCVVALAAAIHVMIERPVGRPLRARITRMLGGQAA